MVDEQRRRALVDDLAQMAAERFALERVESGGRLVEAEQPRRRRQSARDADQLPVGLRQLTRHRLAQALELEDAERLFHLRRPIGRPGDDLPHGAQGGWMLGRDRDVLVHREVVEQLDRLPRSRQAHARPDVRRLARQVVAVEQDAAAIGNEARDGVDEGRLAGAVGPDQAERADPGSIRRSTSTTARTPPKLTDNACVSRTGVTQLTLRAAVRDCETITRIINNMLNSRVKRCYCRLAVTANIHSWITRDGRVTNVALTHARRT